ncbi:uncharacterized protein LOC110020320 [Phalaenopsis equestris]|uniref:uncharacterized protein LOC110020320 n=1 Tax=Phalaenopsis equestris TaxID=78828 RepID=UPI0009E5663B|nr:uncharacterized protein LOC110020320 [Phalaenopsis equestris]
MVRGGIAGVETAVVVAVAGLVVITPLLLVDGGETAREFIEGLFGPIGLLFVPVTLLIFIQFLSSNPGVQFSRFLSGSPDVLSQINGPSTGIVLVLFIVLLLLYTRVFGGGDSDD